MDREQQIAYINSQSICALAEIEGMKAENARVSLQGSRILAYDSGSFFEVPKKYGITHDQIMEMFFGL